MKKNLKIVAATFTLMAGLWLNGFLCAEDKTSKPETGASKPPKESLINSTFVLETDDESAAESLERISGEIDRGFSSPENTYKSEERPGAGPFAKEKAEEKKRSNAGY